MPLSSLLSLVILQDMNRDTWLCSPFRLQPAQKTQAVILSCHAWLLLFSPPFQKAGWESPTPPAELCEI